MKNLVMGVAKGYSWDILEPFVISFARNCRSAELILFVDDISDFTRARLASAERVHVLDIPAAYREILIIHLRWKMCADVLERFGANYAQVFITDTRDVIFQSDPFENFKDYTKYLGYTTEAEIIGKEKINYRWITDCFGRSEADKLAEKKIICCGTVIGTTAEMDIFCRAMWDALKDKTIWGHEQATMNYLVYEKLLPLENLVEISVDGEIFTVGLTKNFSVQGDKILQSNDNVPDVIHQYDRHDKLLHLVDNIYRHKDFQVTENFADARSMFEQIFCLLRLDKFDDTVRLCMRILSDKTNRVENVDYLLKLWEFVLQRPLTPAIGFIELTIQDSLKHNNNFSINQLSKICSLLIHSLKDGRGIEHEFKNFVVHFLLHVIEQTLSAGNAEFCFHFIEIIKSFNLPLDKNFYLLQAKANRIFGRKEEALAAYKKVLDLS